MVGLMRGALKFGSSVQHCQPSRDKRAKRFWLEIIRILIWVRKLLKSAKSTILPLFPNMSKRYTSTAASRCGFFAPFTYEWTFLFWSDHRCWGWGVHRQLSTQELRRDKLDLAGRSHTRTLYVETSVLSSRHDNWPVYFLSSKWRRNGVNSNDGKLCYIY